MALGQVEEGFFKEKKLMSSLMDLQLAGMDVLNCQSMTVPLQLTKMKPHLLLPQLLAQLQTCGSMCRFLELHSGQSF